MEEGKNAFGFDFSDEKPKPTPDFFSFDSQP